MKKLIITTLISFSYSFLQGQSLNVKDLTLKLKPVNPNAVETYLSPDGSLTVMLTPTKLYMINNDLGTPLREIDLIKKAPSTAGSRTEAEVNQVLEQGSAFAVMPEANRLILLDWSKREQIVEVVNTATGKSLWRSNKFRYVNTLKEAGEKVVVNRLLQGFAQKTGAEVGETETNIRYEPFFVSSPHPFLSRHAVRLCTPVQYSGGFLLKTGNSQTMLDLDSGTPRWEFDAFGLVVGSFKVLPDRNEIVLVNSNEELTGKNSGKQTAVVINISTGKERFRFEPTGYIDSRSIKVMGEYLILDAFMTTVVDLNSGNVLISPGKRAEEQSGTGRFFDSQQSFDQVPAEWLGRYSLVQEGAVYVAYIKTSGGNLPASSAIGSKNTIAKYDLKTGEQLWEAEDVADALTQLVKVENGKLILNRKGLSRQSWILLDTDDGTVQESFEVDKGAAAWLKDGALLAGKKELKFYDYEALNRSLNAIEYKDLKAGKLDHVIATSSGVFCVGKTGVAWVDAAGELEKETSIDKLDRSLLVEEYAVLFTKKSTQVIDIGTQTKLGQFELGFDQKEDKAMLTTDGKTLVIIDNQSKVKVVKFVME